MTETTVTDVRFVPAKPDLRATGMRGWASCIVDGKWRFDSMSVRRGRDGRYRVAFPTRTDANGVEHALYLPTERATTDAIEDAVLAEVRKRGFIS